MAASTSKPVTLKQLVDLLKDQQEPFTLDAYLSERKYMKKKSNSGSRNSSNIEDLTTTCSSKRRILGLPYGSRTLRLVLNALISYKNRPKLSSYNRKAQKIGGEKDSKTSKKMQHNAESNRSSSSSCMTVCDSISRGNVEDHCPPASPSQSTFQALIFHTSAETEAASKNTKLQWGCIEDSKQLSPVSVQEELPSEEVSFFLSKKAKEDSTFSAYQCELLAQSLNQKQNGVGVAEFEELGKLICEQMQYSWGKQCGDVTNITQLINFDFSNTMMKWSDFRPLARDIGIEIGDAILGDILAEMIYSELYRS